MIRCGSLILTLTWTSGRKPVSEVQLHSGKSMHWEISKAQMQVWVWLLLSWSYLEGFWLTHQGWVLCRGGINGIVSSNASSGPCLLTSVELFSMLPLDWKDMKKRNSPSGPWRKSPFLGSAPGCVTALCGGNASRVSQVVKATFPIARQVWGLQVNSLPLPLTAGSVSTECYSINKLKHCFLLEEVFK